MATRIGFGASITFYNGETEVYSQSWATADSSIETLSLKTVLEGVTIDAPTSKTFANQWACYASGKYLKTFDDTETVADVLHESSWVSVEAYAVFKWPASSIMLASPADLESVADSIRTKSGSSDKLSFPDGFINALEEFGTRKTVDIVLPKLKYWINGHNCLVELNGSLHGFGGMNGANYQTFNGSEWISTDTRLPYSCVDPSAVVLGDELHILGGGNYSYESMYHYKFDSSTWTSVSTLPYRHDTYGRAVVLNDEIHIFCGYPRTSHYKFDGSAWASASTLPCDFGSGSGSVVLNDEIHILGGGNGSRRHYKFDGSTWTSVGTLPVAFLNGSPVSLGDEIHILGGSDAPTSHYAFNGSTWTSVGILPRTFYGGCATVINNKIVIVGGNIDTTEPPTNRIYAHVVGVSVLMP